MVDIHSHMNPLLDDGAESMEQALAMARVAVAGGTTRMILTSHCNLTGLFGNYDGPLLREQFAETCEAVKEAGIPLELALGMEVFATPDVPRLLRNGRLITLNDSRYLLIEFDFDEDPRAVTAMLAQIAATGVIPVMAHPERYTCLQHEPYILYDWVCSGCLAQINKGSVMGRFGPEAQACARRFLEHHLVHFAASDAHSESRRTPNMARAYHAVAQQYGEDYAKVLFVDNPQCVWENRPIVRQKPIPFEGRGRL